jgi:hypothetical protein
MADEVATAEETPGAEEVSNPDAPAAESKEESNEPNDDAKTGVKYKGVVNWFNVAKGFGELAISLIEVLFSRSSRPRPSVPAGPAGSPPDFLSPECKHHSLLWLLTVTSGPGATASPFTHRARPRHLRGKKALRGLPPYQPPRKTDSSILAPPRRLRDARRRGRRRVRAPVRHLRGGFPQLARPGARRIRARAHGRRQVQGRQGAFASSPKSKIRLPDICHFMRAFLGLFLRLTQETTV